MVRRSKNTFELADITRRSNRTHWIVVTQDDSTRKVLDSRMLAPQSDLLDAFLSLLLEYHRAGWDLIAFNSHHATCYCRRDGARRHLQITLTDPAMSAAASATPKV